jgi:ABC-type transporter lipoprotein component MlaA
MHRLRASSFRLPWLGCVALAGALGGGFQASSPGQSVPSGSIATNQFSITAETVVLPKSVPDPLEPFNRVIWGFNKAVMTGVIKPTSRVYRFVVVKPVRTGIGNFGHNLTYPGRLINNLLQGKWRGARDESYRFACNTTVGVAGFFDPATKWKIPKSEADFGQTFGQWGWQPHCFLMLPFLGPSNERDTLGLAADTAANPLLYIAPYQFDINKPLTYLGPYTYLFYMVMYNNLTDTVGEYVRFSQAEMDPYSEIQYAWTFARANRVADFQVKGKQDKASLETLNLYFSRSKILNSRATARPGRC